MKTHWYMKHPVIFGILMPAVGIEVATLLSMLFQLPFYYPSGRGVRNKPNALLFPCCESCIPPILYKHQKVFIIINNFPSI